MFKYINQCDIYVGLWCIYMLQEVLYSPGIINQLIQLVMLLWGLIALCKYLISSENSSILKATFILIGMYSIYGTFHIMFGDAIMMRSQYLYLQASLNSLLPIFLFYYFSSKGILTSTRIRIYLPLLILVCILLFYKFESTATLQTNTEEVTNNTGYMFLTLIPFLFFYTKKPFMQFVMMGIIFLYVFLAMKRGAIIIAVMCLFILLYANFKDSSKWNRVFISLLSIIILLGINILFNYMMGTNEYFVYRLEQTLEGNSSGRDLLYKQLLDTILLESKPIYFYLGRGADSTLKIAGNYAHQDWLETFCNNGLLGVVLLFSFFYNLAKNMWLSRHYFPRIIFYSFATLFLITFTKTLFSMSIQDLDLSESMLIGYFAYWGTQRIDEYKDQEIDDFQIGLN